MQETLYAHHDYWQRKPMTMPLIAFHIGDTLVSKRFKAATPLLVEHKPITPEMLVVEDFLLDYERMFAESLATGQNGLWVAEPFTGIPWMEAMLGCKVIGSPSSFMAERCMSTIEELEALYLDLNNPWLRKYLEFTEKLVKLSQGRFPVGQPIMRGPSDIVGTLIGQSDMILMMFDEPERLKAVFHKVAGIFKTVIQLQQKKIPPFLGGGAIGFYHLWTPEPSIWFQEDLTALFSPDLYTSFLKEPDRSICLGYKHTLVHLHPSSFFILDDLLGIEELKAIEINKDVEGPGIEEMLPIMKKIQAKKNLVVWGELDEKDLDTIFRNMPDRRMHLSILVPSAQDGKRLSVWCQTI